MRLKDPVVAGAVGFTLGLLSGALLEQTRTTEEPPPAPVAQTTTSRPAPVSVVIDGRPYKCDWPSDTEGDAVCTAVENP